MNLPPGNFSEQQKNPPRVLAAAAASASGTLWGALETQTGTAATEDRARVPMAMFEFNWASLKPYKGQLSASYLATMRSELAVYQAAGMHVTMAPGIGDAPWVFSLANGTYTDQDGYVSTEADWIFSAAVRSAAAAYFNQIVAGRPLPVSAEVVKGRPGQRHLADEDPVQAGFHGALRDGNPRDREPAPAT